MIIIKPLKGYEKDYFATYDGQILSVKNKLKPLKLWWQTKNGEKRYACVHVGGKKNGKVWTLHRLIALTFIPNPDNLPVVDHINRNKEDNRVENLRWASLETNAQNNIRVIEAKYIKSKYAPRKYRPRTEEEKQKDRERKKRNRSNPELYAKEKERKARWYKENRERLLAKQKVYEKARREGLSIGIINK